MNKVNFKGWGILAVVVVAIAGTIGVRFSLHARRVDAFREHLESYAQEAKGDPTPGRRMNGKLVAVDLDSKTIDDLHFDLPDDLRAETPEDVGTVVQLHWDKLQVGSYNGKPAWKQSCQVRVMDKPSGELIETQPFWGGDPPSAIDSNASAGWGSRPDKEIVEFLGTLPRQ